MVPTLFSPSLDRILLHSSPRVRNRKPAKNGRARDAAGLRERLAYHVRVAAEVHDIMDDEGQAYHQEGHKKDRVHSRLPTCLQLTSNCFLAFNHSPKSQELRRHAAVVERPLRGREAHPLPRAPLDPEGRVEVRGVPTMLRTSTSSPDMMHWCFVMLSKPFFSNF